MSSDYWDIKQQIAVPRYAPRPEPTAIPTAAWNDMPLFCLAVNDQWVSHLLGVMTALDQQDTWIGTDDEIYAARQQVNEIMLQLMTGCEGLMSYPQHATLWHDEATILVGGALTRASLADSPYNIGNSFYNTISYQSSAANGDSFSQSILLDAGDYNFYALGAHNNVHGKLDWYLDDVLFLSGQDWYASSVQANQLKTGTVTVLTAGKHTLKAIVNGKNGSSFAYAIPLTKYWLEYVP